MFELAQQEPPQLWRTDKNSLQDVHLTPLEARLLVFLAQRPMRWVTVEALADEVWDDSETATSSIQAAVSRLRKKLNGFEHLIQSGASKYRLNTKVCLRSALCRGQSGPNLSGDCWHAVWQTTVNGKININTEILRIRQRGNHLALENNAKSAENAVGGFLWRGEATLYDGRCIMGQYLPREPAIAAKGTLYFVLNATGSFMVGIWAGRNHDFELTWGYGTIARDKNTAANVLQSQLDSPQGIFQTLLQPRSH